MQFISLFIFTIICGYSLVISAPVNQKVPDSPETKQQKATAIAGRLLKELAQEQHESHAKEESLSDDETNNEKKPVNHQETEKVTSHFSKEEYDNNDEGEQDEVDITPIINDLYETYGDNYGRVPDEEDLSSELDDEDIYPLIRKQLIRYLAAKQQESDEPMIPSQHSQQMDDRIMAAEDH